MYYVEHPTPTPRICRNVYTLYTSPQSRSCSACCGNTLEEKQCSEKRGAEPTQDSAANKTLPTESGTEHTFMTGEFLSIHRFHGNIIEKWTEKKSLNKQRSIFCIFTEGWKSLWMWLNFNLSKMLARVYTLQICMYLTSQYLRKDNNRQIIFNFF